MTLFLAQEDTSSSAEAMSVWIQPLIEQFSAMGSSFMAFLPSLVLGLLILGAGVLIAKILRSILRKVGKKLQIDAAAEKLGIKDLVSKLGVRSPLHDVIATAIYWVVLFCFLKVAADVVGVKDVSAFIRDLILFFPRLFVSLLILLGGLLIASFLKGMVQSKLEDIEFEYAGLVSGFLYGLLSIMIFTMVLSQLGIETDLVNSSVKIFLGALALAIAIALGFGLRPVAKNIVSGVYARDLFPPGSIVEIEDSEATIVEIGAVATRLERGENRFFVVPNSQLLSQVTRGKHGITNLSEKV